MAPGMVGLYIFANWISHRDKRGSGWTNMVLGRVAYTLQSQDIFPWFNTKGQNRFQAGGETFGNSQHCHASDYSSGVFSEIKYPRGNTFYIDLFMGQSGVFYANVHPNRPIISFCIVPPFTLCGKTYPPLFDLLGNGLEMTLVVLGITGLKT